MFTVEFGTCRDSDGKIRGWGAGIASSIGECQVNYLGFL
jgi:phenylalanine-4-hydroxylase